MEGGLFSAIRRSDIYGRRECMTRDWNGPGWEKAGFDDSNGPCGRNGDAPLSRSPAKHDPVRVVSRSNAKQVTAVANGAYVFDMGQNMVGWVTLKVKGAAGTRVQPAIRGDPES